MKTTLINGKRYSFTISKNYTDEELISTQKTNIENLISDNGLKFRFADISDIDKISNFQKEIFYPHTATLETDYELFRIIQFGYALLIENPENELLACYTTTHYGTTHKDGYGIRVGVSPKINGQNYGAHLAKYATILAYENGCKNFRALCRPSNFGSASNVLNYVGYYGEKFHKNLPSFGARFEITLPLNSTAFKNRQIDITKVLQFMGEAKINQDYLLISPDEIDRMETVYEKSDFKIIAFLKEGLIDKNNYFFAVKLT